MSHTKLLVFSTVYLLKSPFLRGLLTFLASFTFLSPLTLSAETPIVLNQKPGPEESINSATGYCYEIYTGNTLVGSSLELKKFEDNIHSTLSFTMFHSKSKTTKNHGLMSSSEANPTHVTSYQLIQSDSDEYFSPIKSFYEIYKNNKLAQSRTSSFEALKNTILISTKDLKSKKPIKSEQPKGLVLAQQMLDLLFARKKITEINPKENLVFQTFSESEGEVNQVTTALEMESDHLVLIHQIKGTTYKTTHASDGRLISSHELTKNIKTKPCTSTSVLTHLNSALSYNKFKSLFSSEDREKIKKCCQHF
jgi:hypothetical protein